MFNEAFWFFYLIGIAGSISHVLWLFAALAGFGLAIFIFLGAIEADMGEIGWSTYRDFLKKGAVAILSASLLASLIPTETAFYAGGGQYVVQATEIDGTVMRLKELIDKRIAEELEAEGDK